MFRIRKFFIFFSQIIFHVATNYDIVLFDFDVLQFASQSQKLLIYFQINRLQCLSRKLLKFSRSPNIKWNFKCFYINYPNGERIVRCHANNLQCLTIFSYSMWMRTGEIDKQNRTENEKMQIKWHCRLLVNLKCFVVVFHVFAAICFDFGNISIRSHKINLGFTF